MSLYRFSSVNGEVEYADVIQSTKNRCKLKERSTSTKRRRTSDVMQDDTLEFVDLCRGKFQTTGVELEEKPLFQSR